MQRKLSAVFDLMHDKVANQKTGKYKEEIDP